ncbi:Predicted arabinose efflux permease, MFS family [Roseateles sp. YR242]|uniref:MFS transporter n=1 Tax=Roseateles sp. YR242 TaxID=1855305 RepID=UPI0008B82125|nr:MFS transporter [Roseateles sp. YR242]SEL61240.1 Predicted arabinose efflux permease, MFS family [Roseateles sp. YR242]
MEQRQHPAWLAGALCVITTGVNLQAPLYATYARADGVGVMATTIAFSFYVAGVLPVLLALGGLSDRIGRRRVMLLALALSALGTALMMAHPHVTTLAAARFILGTGTALMSATATAYMLELFGGARASRAANWVTASTSIGFGLGPVLTSLCLMFQESVAPPSFLLHLMAVAVSAVLVWRLPETVRQRSGPLGPMLRLPYVTRDGLWFGGAILLCWATTGLVISILPSALAVHGLSRYSGLATMLAISCGLLFQPMARRQEPRHAVRLGLMILVPAYAVLAWGAWSGTLVAVLLGSLAASSACYGFVYLGGLAGTAEAAGAEKTRATAAYFLMAYIGFSVPVIFTGLLADRYGTATALLAFGLLLALGTVALLGRRMPQPADFAELPTRPAEAFGKQ